MDSGPSGEPPPRANSKHMHDRGNVLRDWFDMCGSDGLILELPSRRLVWAPDCFHQGLSVSAKMFRGLNSGLSLSI